MSKPKSVKNSILSVLPDNRPITALQIVEDHEKYVRLPTMAGNDFALGNDRLIWTFSAYRIPDAREISRPFTAHMTRMPMPIYGATPICSANDRHGICVCRKVKACPSTLSTLSSELVHLQTEASLAIIHIYCFRLSLDFRVCGERELPGEGFSILTRTADTEHKAWRKRQICYRLAKRGSVKQAVTDIILCSKMKTAPDGFTMAGDINGVTVCYKVGPIAHRPPPSVPLDQQAAINELEGNLYYMNIQNASNLKQSNGKADNGNNNGDYEILQTSYRLSPPKRLAPKPPVQSPTGNYFVKIQTFVRIKGDESNMEFNWLCFHWFSQQVIQTDTEHWADTPTWMASHSYSTPRCRAIQLDLT